VWFQDEARVGQKGTLTRVWAERGSRPRAPHDTRYGWTYIFGAVCVARRATGRAATAALVVPQANARMMNLHLEEIAAAVAPDAHAILVMDGAGWHKPQALDMPSNITPLILPPYSPELNPIENVWAYLRANKLAISVFDTYDDILDACCKAWNFFANDKHRVKSVTSRDWIKTVND